MLLRWWFLYFLLPASAQASTQLTFADQVVHLNFQPGFDQPQRLKVTQWLQQAGDAIRQIYGELPQDAFSFNLSKSASSRGPVPWGQVNRGVVPSVNLTVNPNFDLVELQGDWTVYHELSHLLIPYRGYGDLWLSEGLASYYQNIVQGRAGLLSEQAMWQKLYAGLERGRKAGRSTKTLIEASNNLRGSGQYMRVYWSGALFWLEVDVYLRTHKKGNLDGFLKSLKDCCQTHRLSAPSIIQKLDNYAESDQYFNRKLESFRQTKQIGDYQSLLVKLGIISTGSKVKLNDNAELASTRRAIYTGNRS